MPVIFFLRAFSLALLGAAHHCWRQRGYFHTLHDAAGGDRSAGVSRTRNRATQGVGIRYTSRRTRAAVFANDHQQRCNRTVAFPPVARGVTQGGLTAADPSPTSPPRPAPSALCPCNTRDPPSPG